MSAALAVPSKPPTADDKPLRVLLVDDDELDRLMVKRLLRTNGLLVQITEAGTALDALSAMALQRFDCVILDFHLPRHNGLHVLMELRASGDRTPVLMLTGQDSPDIAAELIKAGASDYLAKDSLTPGRLGHSVSHALQVSRLEEEARAALDALRASEELNRKMLSASQDCICVLSLDGTLISMNEGVQALLGVEDVRAFVGQSWASFWPDPVPAKKAIDAAVCGGSARFTGFAPSAKGEELWWDVMVNPIAGADGRAEKILTIARDITEHHQRQGFEEQLVGIVSHDLRNPLNAILLASDLIIRRGGVDVRTERSVGQIKTAAQRASRMIHDLLDFTRARLGGSLAICRRHSDLAALGQQVVEEVRLAWPDRTVNLVAAEPVMGQFDPDRIAQVFTNLLCNALQYSPKECAVTVTARCVGDDAVIEVHNLGQPIAREALPRIFEPLQRGTSQGSEKRSIGLGLYIVRHIVQAHQGTIEVTSEAGDGTRFAIRLPR